jgi:hypothetical protein
MLDAWNDAEVCDWMREHPRSEGYALMELAERFHWEPDRLRDRLRRRVVAGELTQSAPVTGIADNNPTYAFRSELPTDG